MTIELYQRYRARVRIRRGAGYAVKPEAEALDGRELVVEAAWRITAEESALYAGEYAMRSKELEPYGLTWIASGDLVELELELAPQ